eukprot:jgi/Mesen1/9999/ME000072S09408
MPSERENSCSGGDDSSSCDQTTSAAWEKSTKVKRRKGQNDEVGKEGLIVDGNDTLFAKGTHHTSTS